MPKRKLALLVVFVAAVSDPDDPGSSLLVIWTRGGISAATAGQVAMLAGGVMFGAWLVALGFAVGGLVDVDVEVEPANGNAPGRK